jgi:hypothetical protein
VKVLVGDDRQEELSCDAVRDRRVDVDRVVRRPDAVASRNKASLKLDDVDLTGLWRQCEDPAARQDLLIGRDVVGKDGIVDVESADAVDFYRKSVLERGTILLARAKICLREKLLA